MHKISVRISKRTSRRSTRIRRNKVSGRKWRGKIPTTIHGGCFFVGFVVRGIPRYRLGKFLSETNIRASPLSIHARKRPGVVRSSSRKNRLLVRSLREKPLRKAKRKGQRKRQSLEICRWLDVDTSSVILTIDRALPRGSAEFSIPLTTLPR